MSQPQDIFEKQTESVVFSATLNEAAGITIAAPKHSTGKIAPKERHAGIDTFRVLGSFCVVLTHFFSWYGFEGGGPVYKFFYVYVGNLVHYAVPFFLIVFGFFLHRSVASGKRLSDIMAKYATKLLTLYAFWAVVCNVAPYIGLRSVLNRNFLALTGHFHHLWKAFLANPYDLLITGGTLHLWFLTNMVLGALWVLAIVKVRQEKWMFAIGTALYIVHLVTGNYSYFFASADLGMLDSFFIAAFYLSLGYALSQRRISMSVKKGLVLICIGYAMKLAESFLFYSVLGITERQRDVVGQPLVGLGVFFIAYSMSGLRQGSAISRFGRYSLGVYAAHIMICEKIFILPIVNENGVAKAFSSFLVYGITLGLVYGMSKIPPLRRFVVSY